MEGLFDLNNMLLTPFVNVIAKKDTQKIENRLLDGSFHIQILGQAADLLDVRLYAKEETTKERIELAESQGEELRIAVGHRSWTGIIRMPLAWTKKAGVFSTSFEFLVTAKEEVPG